MSVELDRLLGRLADEQRLLTGYSGAPIQRYSPTPRTRSSARRPSQ